MSPGDRHVLNGYAFTETLHGPMVWGTCVDCGGRALESPDSTSCEARCSTCGRAHHGALLSYYGTGRAQASPRVTSPELERLRAEANAASHRANPRATS